MFLKFCDYVAFTKKQLTTASLILSMVHKMAFAPTFWGSRAIHLFHGSWLPISKTQMLNILFSKQLTTNIIQGGGIKLRMLLGCWRRCSKNFYWKAIYISFSCLMLLIIVVCCIISFWMDEMLMWNFWCFNWTRKIIKLQQDTFGILQQMQMQDSMKETLL